MKRVLLTGATGFIGRHVAPKLEDAGFEVHAVVPRERFDELREMGWGAASVVLHTGDLLDAQDQRRIIRDVRPTHAVHLAWYVVHGAFWNALENVDWLTASLGLMRGFAEYGGERWIGAGTCAEYDWTCQGDFDELTTPLQPGTLYGASKRALFDLQTHLAARLGIEFTWGRVFHLYGPGEPPGRLVPTVIRRLLDGSPAPLSHGNQVRDFMHVEDVAAAFVALLTSGAAGPVNIGSGERTTIRAVVETIAGLLDRTHLLRFGEIPANESEPKELVPRVERLRSTGFTPRWPLAAGLAGAIEWWRRGSIPPAPP